MEVIRATKENGMIDLSGLTKAHLKALLKLHFAVDDKCIELIDACVGSVMDSGGANIPQLELDLLAETMMQREVTTAAIIRCAMAGTYEPLASVAGSISFGAGVAFDVDEMSEDQLAGLLTVERQLCAIRCTATIELGERLKAGKEPASQLFAEWSRVQNDLSEGATREIYRVCNGGVRKNPLN